ncbi:MAG: amidohydrolase [Chloroflexi bacterium]|nr:amidohydrolase [Chloroflexota bacterium]
MGTTARRRAIIDTHVHVWALDEGHQPPPSAVLKPPASAMPVEWLLDDMAIAGIDHCVLVTSSAFGWDNSYMVECLERYPGVFRAVGLIDPRAPDNADHLRQWVAQGLSGFRFHPLYFPDEPSWVDDPANDALWRAAADTGAIFQFHLWPRHAVPLARMIERHPTVRVIVDHIGKPDVTEPAPYPSYQPVLRLADFPLVWVKIGDYQIASQVEFPWPDTRPFVAALRRAFGPERLIWGTGYAGTGRLVPLRQALAYVHEHLDLSEVDLDLILDRTPRALFSFDGQ